MRKLNPEDYRKSAVRCRQQALAVTDANGWVRFLQAWETVAAMSERLMATGLDRGARDRGAGPPAVTV